MPKSLKNNTIDSAEVAKFTAMADEWWDENGKFRPLHLFNPVRIRYIRDSITAQFGKKTQGSKPLSGIRILDIGCGGGLLAEPLARLGATVTGVDASEKNIRVATLHAKKSGVAIQYKHAAAEDLVRKKQQFDVVLAMEIVEHVADVNAFLSACAALVKPGGLLFVATLNRTPKSFLFGIVGAEYVMRWLPRGTHDWRKFLKPSEIAEAITPKGFSVEDIKGVSYRLLTADFLLTNDPSVNYLLRASKTPKASSLRRTSGT
jgi:2-polyprenyl-6-hydroxyphenyl methylase/3-demethylubiquinone-9 3-methyltransferase